MAKEKEKKIKKNKKVDKVATKEPKKKKIKLNDKINRKKSKKESYISDEAREIKNFVITLLSIIVVVLIIYGVSKIFVKEEEKAPVDNTTPATINYDIVTVGTMLSKVDKEYYVMVYDGEDKKAVVYSAVIGNYLSKKDALNVYFCDLSNKLNSEYISKDGKSNPDAKSIEEFAFGKLTLIKVKNNKVVKYIEGLDTIKKEFGA